MKKKHIAGAVIVAIAVIAGWWWFGHAKQAAAAASADEQQPSVLVQTAAVRRQALPLSMNVFGEIGPGLPQALSFPQAGQLVRLAVVAGQSVRHGDLIAVIASDPAAVSSYAQAASAVPFAQRELQRTEQMFGLQLATQSQVDAARKQLADASAALAAQARLGGANASAQLKAPFDGIVVGLPVAQGDRVAAGATVAQVGRSDRLRALLAIEPAQSTQVKAGMPVTITPVQDGAAPIEATIDEVQDMVDPKSQMVTAIAKLPAAGRRVVAGTRVQAAIRLGQREAWAVPRQAVLGDEKGSYLFQVASQRAHRVDVARVAETGQVVGVAGPIQPGQPVVVLGNYELADGMQVREGAR
jgi:RND family efflux transporter MFP subunit